MSSRGGSNLPAIAGRNYSNGDVALGVGLIVAFIAVFLPWYSASFNGGGIAGYGGFSTSAGGLSYWSGWLFFLAVIAGIALFVLRNFASSVKIPAMPQSDAMIYTIIGVVMVIMAVFWLLLGSGSTVSGAGYSAGPSFGLFVGLIAAIAVAVGGFLKRSDPQPTSPALATTGTGPTYGGGAPPPPPPA
jgi:hypothetical protein